MPIDYPINTWHPSSPDFVAPDRDESEVFVMPEPVNMERIKILMDAIKEIDTHYNMCKHTNTKYEE